MYNYILINGTCHQWRTVHVSWRSGVPAIKKKPGPGPSIFLFLNKLIFCQFFIIFVKSLFSLKKTIKIIYPFGFCAKFAWQMKNLLFKAFVFICFNLNLFILINFYNMSIARFFKKMSLSNLSSSALETSVSKDKPLSSSSLIPKDDLVGLNDSSSIANKALENSKSNAHGIE